MSIAAEALNISKWVISIIKEDGSFVTTQGIATSVTFPGINRNFDTEARAGLPGILPVPLSYTEQELTISLRGTSKNFTKELARRYQLPITLQLSAIGCDIVNNSDVPIHGYVVGNIQNALNLELTAQDAATSEISIYVTKYELDIDGDKIIYSPADYVFMVDGTNILASQATALGITPNAITTVKPTLSA